jgi:antitoxin component of MazEF toxin-antitoxin module
MSKALSKHSSLRKSGNSLVLTVPADVVKELGLEDGDSVFWGANRFAVRLKIIKLENIQDIPSLTVRGEEEHEGEDGNDNARREDVV